MSEKGDAQQNDILSYQYKESLWHLEEIFRNLLDFSETVQDFTYLVSFIQK